MSDHEQRIDDIERIMDHMHTGRCMDNPSKCECGVDRFWGRIVKMIARPIRHGSGVRSRLDALEASLRTGPTEGPARLVDEQPEPTDEEWRAVLRTALSTPGVYTDGPLPTPGIYTDGPIRLRNEGVLEEILAKQVVAERKRADAAEDSGKRQYCVAVKSFKERDALQAEVDRLKNSPAIGLDGAKDRIKLLEKLLRELLGAATITEGSPSIIGRKMIDRIEKTAFGDDA